MKPRLVYPVLQATPARSDSARRPFTAGVGLFLAFARENEDELELVAANDEVPDANRIDELLRARNLGWEQVVVAPPDGSQAFTILVCEGDMFAAEAVLSSSLLKQAAERLRAHRIAVGVPRRGVAMVARADLPDDQMFAFAMQVAREYTFGEGRELSHRTVFWKTARRAWDGIYPRSDEALACAREDGPEPSSELSARARYARKPEGSGFEYVVEVKDTHAGELRELFKTLLMNICDAAAQHGRWNAKLHVRFDPHTVPCSPEVAAEAERVVADLLKMSAMFEAMAGTTAPIEIRVGWA
jgi:hypothetical protein